jgi:hypothetical protein
MMPERTAAITTVGYRLPILPTAIQAEQPDRRGFVRIVEKTST